MVKNNTGEISNMIYFNNDYSEGCHPEVLAALTRTNMEQTFGYSEDEYCAAAADKIRKIIQREDAAVHFLVGGTQSNLIVIAAALSFICSMGDLMPPTALAGNYAAQIVGQKYSKVLRYCAIPFVVCVLFGLFTLLQSGNLGFLT